MLQWFHVVCYTILASTEETSSQIQMTMTYAEDVIDGVVDIGGNEKIVRDHSALIISELH